MIGIVRVYLEDHLDFLPNIFNCFCRRVESMGETSMSIYICLHHRLNNNIPRQDTIWSICNEELRHITHSYCYCTILCHNVAGKSKN